MKQHVDLRREMDKRRQIGDSQNSAQMVGGGVGAWWGREAQEGGANVYI